MDTVGKRVSPLPPRRSRRALLTHRAPPSGQTSDGERFGRAHRAAARGTAESRPVHREEFLPAVQVVLSEAFLEWAQQAVPAAAAEFADRASFLTGGTVAAGVQVAVRLASCGR